MGNYPNRGNTVEPFERFRQISSGSFNQSNVETASHVSSWLQHSTSSADQVNSDQDTKVVKTEKLQSPINKHHQGLPADCLSNNGSDTSLHNTGYYQFGNHDNGSPQVSNKIRESPSGSSGVSEISRPCSISNLSSGVYDSTYDAPQIDRRYSPSSYQQNYNRYQPYVRPPQTAPPATSFTFFSQNTFQMAFLTERI